MAKIMHDIVLQAIKVIMQKNQFLVISCDEAITVDNQSW
jgi:hypothetical protein